MELRELKALEIAARRKVTCEGGVWRVPSSQAGKPGYRVTIKPDACTCADHELTRQDCKHIMAVKIVLERDGAKILPPEPPTEPLRKTYKQAWPQYNRAQQTEKDRFQVLLHDLCQSIQEPTAAATGRPSIPLKDAVFAVVFKVFSTFSSRRFNCDLQEAHQRGYLSRPIHPNKVNKFMENDTLTAILKGLVVKSSLPLRAIETDFAVDSSGFSTSRFVRWFDAKYNGQNIGREWVKAHILTGVKTNIIAAAEVHDKDSADCPQLPALLATTAQNFRIAELSGDKAYSSESNLEAVVKHGGMPYIAFKHNTTDDKGGLWAKMFYFYQFNREEFLKHYHKRSNVEKAQAKYPSRRRGGGNELSAYNRLHGVAGVGRLVSATPGPSHRRSLMSNTPQYRTPPRA